MLFGNKVRELREENEVAPLLEVDTAMASRIELGSRSIKKRTNQAIGRCIRCRRW